MNARTLMTPEPSVVSVNDTITSAARLMRTLRVGMLPVVDDTHHRHLLGVLTDRDIVVRCVAEGHRLDCLVEDHMTRDALMTVHADSDLRLIADRMEQHQVRRLPVVDSRQRVIGIVTQADLARRVGPEDPELVEEVLERISSPNR
jgi:CBS domain-containing protein